MKKAFNTSIDEEILQQFKEKCKEEKLPFLCLKYISDGADGNAVDDWSTEVKKAAQKLRETLIK